MTISHSDSIKQAGVVAEGEHIRGVCFSLSPKKPGTFVLIEKETTSNDPKDWSIDRVALHLCQLLSIWGYEFDREKFIEAIKEHGVAGRILLCNINDENLRRDLNIANIGVRAIIIHEIERLKEISSRYHDPTNHRSSSDPASRKRRRSFTEDQIIASAQIRTLHRADDNLERARREIQLLEESIEELKSVIELYEQENLELKREKSTLAANRSDDSLVKKYRSLEKKYNTYIANTPYRQLTGASQEWFSSTKINVWWNDVHHRIQQAGLAIKDICTWRSKPSCESEELQRLISKCLGLDLDPDKMVEASSRLSKLKPTSVLQALNTASVLCWVLETDLPEIGGRSELLASYQDNIAAEFGNIALRNLDLAARRRLASSKAFREEQIPGIAKKLSIKLSRILAPLFAEDSRQQEEDWDQFATWGDDKFLWEDRRGHSIHMFTAALKMKADLLLNIEDYEPIIYPPGTLFDKKTMELEWADSMQGSAPQGRQIALCIEPAIFIREREAIDNGCPISDVLILNNFCGKRGKRLPGPVVKARVVLVEDPELVALE